MDPVQNIVSNEDIPIISTEDVEEATEFVNKAREAGQKVLGTHSGVFHCDEVLACSLLKYTDEFKNPVIVRSRNPEVHKLTDILFDVGDVFDPEHKRFDHHQRSFNSYFYDKEEEKKEEDKKEEKKEKKEGDDKFPIKMSSAGLIYKYYGQEIIRNLANQWSSDLGSTEEQVNKAVEEIHKELYDDFVKEIDAVDNGVSITAKGVRVRYRINTGLATRIGRLNPSWNVEDQDPNKPFLKAMGVGEEEFLAQIYAKLKIVRPAYNLVREAFDSRKEFHPSGEMLYFKKTCPWKSHLFKIEEETENEGLVKFVFFQSHDGMYRVQAVSLTQSGFENRISLHEDWRGKREQELRELTGLPSLRFVHHSGFIGGANDFDDAIKMAELSIEKHNQEKEAAAAAKQSTQKVDAPQDSSNKE